MISVLEVKHTRAHVRVCAHTYTQMWNLIPRTFIVFRTHLCSECNWSLALVVAGAILIHGEDVNRLLYGFFQASPLHVASLKLKLVPGAVFR